MDMLSTGASCDHAVVTNCKYVQVIYHQFYGPSHLLPLTPFDQISYVLKCVRSGMLLHVYYTEGGSV